MRLRQWIFALAAACGCAVWGAASDTYVPPLPPLQNKAILAGEKLWSSTDLVGPDGETCAGCHDSGKGPPLDGAALASKRAELDKLVYFCVLTRANNPHAKLNGPEVGALGHYLRSHYHLADAADAEDSPRARKMLAKARKQSKKHDYASALKTLDKTLELALSPRMEAEARALLGANHSALGNEASAEAEFAKALRLAPDARLEPATFPPHTIELFEAARAKASEAPQP